MKEQGKSYQTSPFSLLQLFTHYARMQRSTRSVRRVRSSWSSRTCLRVAHVRGISTGQVQPFRAPRLPGARDSTTSLRCPHQPPAPTPVAGAGPGPWNPGAGVYSVYLGVSFSTCSFVVYDYLKLRKAPHVTVHGYMFMLHTHTYYPPGSEHALSCVGTS